MIVGMATFAILAEILLVRYVSNCVVVIVGVIIGVIVIVVIIVIAARNNDLQHGKRENGAQ